MKYRSRTRFSNKKVIEKRKKEFSKKYKKEIEWLETNKFIESDHAGNEQKIIKKIHAIGKATINIVDILNQIKELEAIKSGKIKVNLGPVNLEEIIQNERFTFETKMESKNIHFSFKNYLDGESILAEKVSLSNNVVNNIISNAIKFCDID